MPPPIEMSPTLTPMSASNMSVACIAFAIVKKAYSRCGNQRTRRIPLKKAII